jgi:SAM-dependent methyltransferase
MEADGRWAHPDTVRGFVQARPNQTLLRFAAEERSRSSGRSALDIGCGAARNAGPLAAAGWDVYGVDTSWPMLVAAVRRGLPAEIAGGLHIAQATMTDLPFAARTFDLVIAHGVWNLATRDQALRLAISEAARVSRDDAALFVFTFSRGTLARDARPLAGESYVYDQFSGVPQIFLTTEQLIEELRGAGFEPDPAVPLTELNRPGTATLATTGPVIHEGAFRRRT